MGLRGPKPGAKVERDVAIISYYCALRREFLELRGPRRPSRKRRTGYTHEEAREHTATRFKIPEETVRDIVEGPFDGPAWRRALPLVIADRLACKGDKRPELKGPGRRPGREITALIEAARAEIRDIVARRPDKSDPEKLPPPSNE